MLTEKEKEHNRKEYRKRIKWRTKKVWIILCVLFFLLIFGRSIWGVIGVNIHYSDGERTVKIIKIAEKGLVWKTWEAEGVLAQEGFAVTYVWNFSVDNQDPNKMQLINDIKTAFETGQTVKIKYDQRAGSVPWRSGTTYFAKEIRFQSSPTSLSDSFKLVSKNDIELAREALTSYFDFLNKKEYTKAVKYHGSGYEILRDWNPTIDIDDHVTLIKNGCEINGLQCLKIKNIVNQQIVSPTQFIFIVQFANNDGTIFKRGPCCGKTEEQMPTETDFEYVVNKVNDNFLITTSPLYAP